MTHAPLNCRTVVTRKGIVIGGSYRPPPPLPSADAETIQAALLEKNPARRPSLVRRLVAALRQHFSMACCMRADCEDTHCPGVAIGRDREDLARAVDQRRGDR